MSGLLGSDTPLCVGHDLALLDLDGVVYVGPAAVPHAAEALKEAAGHGMALRYVTNNASRPAPVVAEHLRELQIPAEDEEVVTSAMAAAALLAGRHPAGSAVLVIGGEGLRWALRREGLTPVGSMDDAPVAVVQGFSPDLGWRDLAEGTRAVRAGVPWLATNTDLTVPTPHGPAPGNGTLVGAVQTASGVVPEVAGKPAPTLFLDGARRAGARAPLVVGDRLDTDLEGARAAAMPGLLVLTGVCTASRLLLSDSHERPDYVGADLRDLLTTHPTPVRDGEGWSCRAARVVVAGSGHVRVSAAGGDPVDLLRAACAAVWTWREPRAPKDATGLDLDALLDVLARLSAGAAWAR